MKPSWAEINLDILADNICAVRQCLRPDTEIVFVVKANAYGHGAVPLARKAAACGVKWLAVAYLHEALEIRRQLDAVDILILGVVEPADVPLLLEHRLTPVVVSAEHGLLLGAEARRLGQRLPAHIKLDTGMGRLGIPWDGAEAHLQPLWADEGLQITGLCSHFAAVEPNHPESAREQYGRFRRVSDARREHRGRPLMRHVSSSRATLHFPEWDLDAVRPGIILYGYGAQDEGLRAQTRPILQWKAVVMQVKNVPADFPVGYVSTYRTRQRTDLATIALGYADGYLRELSNKGLVLVRGRRCPVAGRVSMNWITVDAGPDSGVQAGDEVVLIGEQGPEAIWASELAQLCRTIPYEILTFINSRIERRYIGA